MISYRLWTLLCAIILYTTNVLNMAKADSLANAEWLTGAALINDNSTFAVEEPLSMTIANISIDDHNYPNDESNDYGKDELRLIGLQTKAIFEQMMRQNKSVCGGTAASGNGDNEHCPIDHNVTCVGPPIYCNLTYDEYTTLLYDYIYPTKFEWVLIFSHSIVFIMGLVGNALVCIAVYTNHTMRTVTNIFIVNLAVADFFVILFCLPPSVVWDVTETWFMGTAMCKVVVYFQSVSVTVSVLTLTFISLDRWYAVVFPLQYVSTNKRAIGSIGFIWFVAFLSDLPEFLVLTAKQVSQYRFNIQLFIQCIPAWDQETEKYFYIIRLMFLYTCPLILMSIAYFQIIRILWKSDTIPGHRESSRTQHYTSYAYGQHSGGPMANRSTMEQLRTRRKAAKMLVAVVVMFASCYFPVHVLNILRYTVSLGQSEIIAVLSLLSHWLCYANSAMNPVIYNFMSSKFRREFKHALEKCRCFRKKRDCIDDRSVYHNNTPLTRFNNYSPGSRSNYQLASVRDVTHNQTFQTSFIENGTSINDQIHLQMVNQIDGRSRKATGAGTT